MYPIGQALAAIDREAEAFANSGQYRAADRLN
jgi:hypothetical protein